MEVFHQKFEVPSSKNVRVINEKPVFAPISFSLPISLFLGIKNVCHSRVMLVRCCPKYPESFIKIARDRRLFAQMLSV